MGVVEMSDDDHNPLTKDFLASPALSLSLAGIFRHGSSSGTAEGVGVEGENGREVEEGGEEGTGGGGRREESTVDISSENSGAVRTRSEEEIDGEGENFDDGGVGGGDGDGDGEDDDDGNVDGDKNKRKKRKKYHRHTVEQIREMEALYKESPHPDEKQRQLLGSKLGLSSRQVKFWFQNRRTQLKTIQERHENSLLKIEMDKLKTDNKILKETINNSCCLNCGFITTGKEIIAPQEQHQLYVENAQLKAEIEKLRVALGNEQGNQSSLNLYLGITFGIDKSRIIEIANRAMEELEKMATKGEPLWLLSVETGREILNYDEYMKEFLSGNSSTRIGPKLFIEASRDSGFVFVDVPRLLQSFMDVNQWKGMFPTIISNAAIIEVISNGEGPYRNGAIQLMFAELQMLTPIMPTRGVHFIRYCKQLAAERWAVVDVSIEKVEDNSDDKSFIKCWKQASGCVIEDIGNSHCKVTWVEHVECQKSMVPSIYRSIVNSGMAFGARRWISALQQQCERFVFSVATNVPPKDSIGVPTLAGRKSVLKMSLRMMSSFCRVLGSSNYHNVLSKNGYDIRVCSRKNLNDPGEPLGMIVCLVSSVWLPVSRQILFDFLRDEARRHEWDIMSNGVPAQLVANLSKGQHRGNAITIQAMKAKDNSNMWILQDSCTNNYESMVVYAPVDILEMQNAMSGYDSSNIVILASGFTILCDGMESRPLVIRSRREEDEDSGSEGGSLLTIAIQAQLNNSTTSKIKVESMESVNSIISSYLHNIKTALKCQDG